MSPRLLAAALVFSLSPGLAVAGDDPRPNDLDAFMEEVLKRREINWDDLDRWVFSEREEFALRKGDGTVIERRQGEYVRYVRDGELVRSPIAIDGVKVSAEERERYEQEWRDEHERRRERAKAEVDAEVDAERGGDGEESDLDRETFLGFELEPGNYYLAGRETFEGRDVVVIEYYPERMFSDKGDSDDDDEEEDDDEDDEIERKLDKTTLVTMLILAEQHQIVKVTFDNVSMDFLPMKWLFRFDGLKAWMVMAELEPGVWMPRAIEAHGAVSLASGKLSITYERVFHDYASIDVGVEVEYGAVEAE